MNHDDALLAEQAQAVRQMFERIPFNRPWASSSMRYPRRGW